MNRLDELNLFFGITKPEFGNKEHIELVQKYQKLKKDFGNGKPIEELDVSAKVTISFSCCNCGSDLEFEITETNLDILGNGEVSVSLYDDELDCRKCKTNYGLINNKVYIDQN